MKGLLRREVFGYWLNDRGLLGTGAEIGCACGTFARQMLSTWKGIGYRMVDPWEKQSPDVYQDNMNDSDFDNFYKLCTELANKDKRVTLIRKLSIEAAPLHDDNSLDFVYIDGNHSYRNVMEDIGAWFPKVKLGGILCGHDFVDKTGDGWFCQVESAVKRWATEHDLPIWLTPCTSWWIEKTHH